MQRGWEKGIKSLNSMESKKGGEEEQRMHSTGHTSLPRSAGGRWPRLIFFGFAHDLMFWARKWSDRPHILMSSHLTPDYAEMAKENRHWSVEAQPLEQDCSKVQAGSPSPGNQPPTEVRFWFIPRDRHLLLKHELGSCGCATKRLIPKCTCLTYLPAIHPSPEPPGSIHMPPGMTEVLREPGSSSSSGLGKNMGTSPREGNLVHHTSSFVEYVALEVIYCLFKADKAVSKLKGVESTGCWTLENTNKEKTGDGKNWP